MKNKLINGLGLGALVLGLSGCAGVKSLNTEYISDLGDNPSENFVVETSYNKYGNTKCHEAEVFMNKNQYSITCDNGDEFIHKVSGNNTIFGTNDGNYSTGNLLSWKDVVYFDKDMDGVLDYMTIRWIDYSKDEIKPEQSEDYKELINNLNKDLVQYVWEKRWVP